MKLCVFTNHGDLHGFVRVAAEGAPDTESWERAHSFLII